MRKQTPSREELAQSFADPPLEYSDFMTYFWESGKLSKEQLTWQLEQIKDKGVGGTWYYPRYVRGEPYGPHPAYWSDGWWEFFEHYVAEHERLGMTAWFSEWTGQGYWQDRLREERANHPELEGRRLVLHQAEARAGEGVDLEVPEEEEVLGAGAYRRVRGGLDGDSRQDLAARIQDGRLNWQAPAGEWMVAIVSSQPHDLDYLNPAVARRWLEIYWNPHLEHLGRFVGQTLRGYLQDELFVLNGNIVYAESLLERFKEEKGYDPRPYLVGLFHDIGAFTDKIRCQYYEVMSALLEENLYRPLCAWHEEHNMLFSTIATWGRQDIMGQTYHYGDYFRLCRWFHITGNEDPGASEPGGRCFADAKLSSSILHLYQRERAAMCVYWGAGHGMTQEQNLAWTNENYAYGLNMYNTHGGLYGSLGSWYEWVPPSVHFRQPYWEHWKSFVDYVARLSAVLSQGVHRADVALLYPLTSIHANWLKGDHFTAAADEIGIETLALARHIYESGIDFDFVDDHKLSQAVVSGDLLRIGGLEFRAVLLPPMTTVRTGILEKLKAFYRAGGTVVAFRRLPGGSPEQGRDDPRIRALLQDIFGVASSAEYIHTSEKHRQAAGSVRVQKNEKGGQGIFVPEHEVHRTVWYDPGMERRGSSVPAVISEAIERDVLSSGRDLFHTHQKIGELEVYFLYNVRPEKRMLEFELRVEGQPDIWDAWSGRIIPHYRFERGEGSTRVRLEMERHQGILLVFGPGEGRPEVVEDNLTRIAGVEEETDGLRVEGACADGGRKHLRIRHRGREYVGETRLDPPPAPIRLEGTWGFAVQPTLDNRWGDFRHPATKTKIGPQARIFRYAREGERQGEELGWHQEDFDDAGWREFAYSFGPYWLCLGPFAAGHEPAEMARFSAGQVDLERGYEGAGKVHQWEEHVYSRTMGHASKEVYRASAGMHGIDDHFIYFPATGEEADAVRYLFTYACVPEAGDWDFHFGHGAVGQDQHEEIWEYHFGGRSGAGQQAWINGRQVVEFGPGEHVAVVRVQLEKGLNPVLLKLVHHQGQPVNVFAALVNPAEPGEVEWPPPPRLRWFAGPSTLVYDIAPHASRRVGWYRFEAPSGTRVVKLALEAEAGRAWVNGRPVEIQDGRIELQAPVEGVAQVALRLEQKPGCYAGAAIKEPVEFECDPTSLPLGDWSGFALESYSGGAIYTREFVLDADHLGTEIALDLGRVQVSAEVEVNGRKVGVGLARPYCFDITDCVREGQNRVVVRVFNTMANHYSVAFPSSYVFEGQTVSGLLGPVELRFSNRVRMRARGLQS